MILKAFFFFKKTKVEINPICSKCKLYRAESSPLDEKTLLSVCGFSPWMK